MLRWGIQMLQGPLLVEMSRPALSQQSEGQFPRLSLDVAVLVERIADLGFTLIELNTDLNVLFPDSFGVPAVRRLQALKESHGVSYTVHLPLWSVEPSTPLQWVREGSLEALVDSVLRLAPLEPEVYVLHATGELAAEFYTMKAIPEETRPLVMAIFQGHAARSIEELLRRTDLPPRAIAVETMEFPLELTIALAEEFDLSLCLDTGHILAGYAGPVNFEEALRMTLPRLAEVHLHDGYHRPLAEGIVDRADHLPLGSGDLPLGFLLNTLREAQFNGPVIFELTVQEARESLETIRSLSAEGLPAGTDGEQVGRSQQGDSTL